MILKEQKAEIIKKFGGDIRNTGVPEVQIALLTARIQDITNHLNTNTIKLIAIILLTALIPMTVALGQTQEATTNDGKKVILNADGTWKYAEVKKDTAKVKSSDCSNWITIVIDKVTGDTTTRTKKTLIVSNDRGKTGFGIFMMKGSDSVLILTIIAVGAGSCIDKGSEINILFTDGSRLALENEGDFNCKSEATVYFGDIFGKIKQLEELKTKKIQAMRVWTSDGYVEKDFTTNNQKEFLNVINCLTK